MVKIHNVSLKSEAQRMLLVVMDPCYLATLCILIPTILLFNFIHWHRILEIYSPKEHHSVHWVQAIPKKMLTALSLFRVLGLEVFQLCMARQVLIHVLDDDSFCINYPLRHWLLDPHHPYDENYFPQVSSTAFVTYPTSISHCYLCIFQGK